MLGNTEAPVKRQALERWEFRPSDMASRFGTITSMMSAAILPLIGFLTASALLSTMTGVLVYTGLLEPSDRLYTFFNSIFNLLINFLPVLVGYNCARWLKSSPLVSMVLGLRLVPNFYLNLAANAPSVRAGIRPRVFSSSKTYINNKTVNLKWHGYCLCDKK